MSNDNNVKDEDVVKVTESVEDLSLKEKASVQEAKPWKGKGPVQVEDHTEAQAGAMDLESPKRASDEGGSNSKAAPAAGKKKRKRKRGKGGKSAKKADGPAGGAKSNSKGKGKPPAAESKLMPDKSPGRDEYLELASDGKANPKHWTAMQPACVHPKHSTDRNVREFAKECAKYPVAASAFTVGPDRAILGFVEGDHKQPIETSAYHTVNAFPHEWFEHINFTLGPVRLQSAQKSGDAQWKHPYTSFLRGYQIYKVLLRFFTHVLRNVRTSERQVLTIVLNSNKLAMRIEKTFLRMKADMETGLIYHRRPVPTVELHLLNSPLATRFTSVSSTTYCATDGMDQPPTFERHLSFGLVIEGNWMTGFDWDHFIGRSINTFALGSFYPKRRGTVSVPGSDRNCLEWQLVTDERLGETVIVQTDDGARFRHLHEWWNPTSGEGFYVYRAITIRTASFDCNAPAAILLCLERRASEPGDKFVKRVIRNKMASGSSHSSIVSAVFACSNLSPSEAARVVRTATQGLFWATTSVRWTTFIQRDIAQWMSGVYIYKACAMAFKTTLIAIGAVIAWTYAKRALQSCIATLSFANVGRTRTASFISAFLNALNIENVPGANPMELLSSVNGPVSEIIAGIAKTAGRSIHSWGVRIVRSLMSWLVKPVAPSRMLKCVKAKVSTLTNVDIAQSPGHIMGKLCDVGGTLCASLSSAAQSLLAGAHTSSLLSLQKLSTSDKAALFISPILEEYCKRQVPWEWTIVFALLETYLWGRGGASTGYAQYLTNVCVHLAFRYPSMKFGVLLHMIWNFSVIYTKLTLPKSATMERALELGVERPHTTLSVCGFQKNGVRAGVELRTKGLMLCGAGDSINTEEILSLAEVLPWRCHTCPKTVKAAATSRMGGKLKVKTPSKGAFAAALAEFIQLVPKSVEVDLMVCKEDYVDALKKNPKKHREYRKALESGGLYNNEHRGYELFVKNNEKNMTPLFCTCEKHVMQCNPGNYCGSSPVIYNGFDPRGISVPGIQSRLACGANVRVAMGFLKEIAKTTHIVYAAGLSSEALSKVILERYEALENNTYFFTVLGDDVLLFLSVGGNKYAVEIDTSRQDMHTSLQGIEALIAYLEVVEMITGIPMDDVLNYTKARLAHGKTYKYRYRKVLFNLKMTVPDTTASGDATTALSAALMTILCVLNSFIVGDFVGGFAELGFHAKVKWIAINEKADLSKPTFLQRHFMDTGDEGLVLAPLPGRSASKQFTVLRPEVPVARTRDWLRGNALGLLQDGGHCPVLSALGRRALTLAGGAEGDTFQTELEKRKAEARMHCDTKHRPGKESRKFLHARYGLTDRELGKVLNELELAKWGSRLCEPAWRKVITVDVCGNTPSDAAQSLAGVTALQWTSVRSGGGGT